ncbi:MAG TPA: L,D-transpeptidase [Polyangiales bacterium]
MQPEDAGPPVRLFASAYVVKIRNAPAKQAPRMGYLRTGALVMAKTAKPIGFESCRKGWYELETGGFVCSTTEVLPFLGRRLPERRPTQPDVTARLPYPYGYAMRRNTPVYRRLPSDEEAALYEGYKIPGVDAGTSSAAAAELTTNALPPTAAAAASPDAVNAAPATGAPAAAAAAQPGVVAPAAAGGPGSGGEEPGSAAEEGPPTLASLMGGSDSVLYRRMERGFYVSLDREISKGARSYWQTQATGFIPKSRLLLVKGSEFHGVDLEASGTALPVGFVMSKNTLAYAANAKGRLHAAGAPGYHFMSPIASEAEVAGRMFYVGPDGKHYPVKETTKVVARDKPDEVKDDEKWIDVDLGTQSLVAYVGSKPVYATLVSTGRIKDELDPLRNFQTPTGSFRINAKHLTATMDGDHALDGPYSIEDVPYVMYFQLAYALHSAFWHNSFGRPHSHGCVNLSPDDARWLFFWANPTMPKSWHAIYARLNGDGTRVYIHGETPKG